MTASIWTPGSNNVPAVDPLSQIASQRFTATEGQTLFNITNFTYAPNVGAINVFVNRTKIPTTELTENSTTSFTLLQACDAGDLVEVIGQTAIDDPGNAVAQAEAAAAAAEAARLLAEQAAADAEAARLAAEAAAAIAGSYVPTNWRGQWLPATAYAINDAVFNVDGSYVCTTAHTSSATFAPDAANWTIIAQSGGVVSVNSRVGVVTLDKNDVGLGNVDNTSDANKPISIATQSALNAIDSDITALETGKANLATSVQKDSNVGAAQIPVGTTAERPANADGKFRYNSDLDIFEGFSNGEWGQVGGGQMLGVAQNKAIFFNNTNISENLTLPTGSNGLSAGPVVVDDGFSVTVEPGSVWSIT